MYPILQISIFLFLLASFALAQTFVLYPVGLLIWSRISSIDRPMTEELPTVTLVIAAYNEEDVIAEKIENSLDLSYPEKKLDIVVFSDASCDRTDEIIRTFAGAGVELVRIEGRVGKTACQNRIVEELSTDIVVFSDANSMYGSDAIERLVEGFQDSVGCVVGELRYEGGNVEGESFYWRYERFLKRLEAKVNTLVTGNGAIYAVRRKSYVPLPADAISDFAEPLAIVRNGETVNYAPNAIAREKTGADTASEFDRRVRIVSRSWNTLLANADLLNPRRRPRFVFQLFSHKVLRWLAPLSLLVVLTASVMLVALTDSTVYLVLFVGQVLFYGLAASGAVLDRLGVSTPTLIHIPYYFVVSNVGMARGFVQFLRNGPVVTWETTERNE